jgi:hypothetical protein
MINSQILSPIVLLYIDDKLPCNAQLFSSDFLPSLSGGDVSELHTSCYALGRRSVDDTTVSLLPSSCSENNLLMCKYPLTSKDNFPIYQTYAVPDFDALVSVGGAVKAIVHPATSLTACNAFCFASGAKTAIVLGTRCLCHRGD